MASDFFSIKNLSVSFDGKSILDNVSFTLQKGKLTGLLGVNGSGKSTLLKGICSIYGTYESCTVDGEEIKKLSAKKTAQLISYIPQKSGIELSVSVLDTVLMGYNPVLGIFENPNEEQKKRAVKAICEVGLSEKINDNYLTLSEGQKQLCILARTMVQNTKILLLDEPESSLDFTNKRMLLKKVKETVYNKEKAALICLHDPMCALEFCDRLLIISEGKICDSINPKEDSEEKTANALRNIYGNIEVFRHKGKLFITEEESDETGN